MKALGKLAMIAALGALPYTAASAADVTLDPALGQFGFFNFGVCDANPATPAPTCPVGGQLTGPTIFTVEFLNPGLLNSNGTTSVVPNSDNAGVFTVFNYQIFNPANVLVATGAPQNPLDLAVVTGIYTVVVNWTLQSNSATSASWTTTFTTGQRQQIPEPATLALLGLSLVGLAAIRRRA